MNTQDKKDLKKIVEGTLLEFWDKSLKPALNRLYERVGGLEKKVGGLEKEVKDLGQTMNRVEDRLDDVATEVITHEKRLGKVEEKIHLPA